MGALRCLQEEGFRCPAGRYPACFRGHSVKPSGPYPLGKNQSLSSPPLMPRGHLLSAMRQKVSKDRSQGGSAPLAIPRRNCPNLAKPSCGPTPAAFAEKTPAFECRAAPRTARGGGGARPTGPQLLYLRLNSRARSEKRLCPTVSDRAPGDSFYFAKSEIVESLLRRGARGSLCILQQEPNKSPGGAVARGDFISIVLAHND